MEDFISTMIRLVLKMVLFVVLLYGAFMVVAWIWNDMSDYMEWKKNGGEETTVVEEKKVEKEDVVVEEVAKPTTKKKKGPVTMFSEPRECVGSNDFKVEIILDGKYVIAKELFEGLEKYGSTTDLTVVFIDNDNSYYTDQVIKVPKGKCARQVGVYKSTHFMYDDKTLPIVEFMSK